jgi:hypothetical protein
VAKIAPDESAKIIQAESKRLDEALQRLVIERNPLVKYLQSGDIPLDAIAKAALASETVDVFTHKLLAQFPKNEKLLRVLDEFQDPALRDFATIRRDLQNPEVALREQEMRRSRDLPGRDVAEHLARGPERSTQEKATSKKLLQTKAANSKVTKKTSKKKTTKKITGRKHPPAERRRSGKR